MHFKPFSSFFQFLPLQVEETYFFRDGLNQGLIRFLPPGGRNLPTLGEINERSFSNPHPRNGHIEQSWIGHLSR